MSRAGLEKGNGQNIGQVAEGGGTRDGASYRHEEMPILDCKDRIGANRRFCDRHRTESEQGLIDKCPGCGRAKYKQYGKCIDCSRKPRRRMAKATATNQTYSPEYSKAWEKGDATADRFFVYLLKLDGGEFYAGQTRELRARLSEHRDGGAKSTVGRNPKLVWFGMLQTREAATAAEVELKKLVDSNPREVRRMVIDFEDLVRELDYS